MSAGDGYFSLESQHIHNDIKSKDFFSNGENNFIDNKGDNSESAKICDNNFTERLANFMKNSKSLLENVDKKHSVIKFENPENNISYDKCNNTAPESPSYTLVKLEESLMQLNDSKSKYIRKENNKPTIDHPVIINSNIGDKDSTCGSSLFNDFIMPSANNIYLKSDNLFSLSNSIFPQDCKSSSSNLSLNKIANLQSCDQDEIRDIKEIVNVRHSRHLTYSGATKLFKRESHFSKVVDFKLALVKKRTNSLKGINKNNLEEGLESNSLQINKKNGFQCVINAIFNRNQSQKISNTSSYVHSSKESSLNEKEIDVLSYPYVQRDVSIKVKCKNIEELNRSNLVSEDKDDIPFVLNIKNHKKVRDCLSMSSNISVDETFEEIKKLSESSSLGSSKSSIFTTDSDTKLGKSEICDKLSLFELNISSEHDSPIVGIEMIKKNMDYNEKENISESIVAERETSDNQPKKYTANRSHNFQEALRIDELENELYKMKSNLMDKDKKISLLKSDPKIKYKTIATDVNTTCYEEVVRDQKKTELCKASVEFLVNGSSKLIYGPKGSTEHISFKDTQKYSSIEDYNPNNSSVLRNKIKDLESQIQDLQEANENAAQFMLSFKEKNVIETNNNTNAIVSELVDKNQSLRDEVDRLRQSIPALKGDTISSQFLRQELENLKEDLYMLKHQNNLIVKENIALKSELKKRDNKNDSHIKHEDRKPVLYQLLEHTKQNQFTYNDTYEINNHSKDLSDSDNSLDLLSKGDKSNHQVKSMSVNNLSKEKSNSNIQPMKVCKILPQNFQKKSGVYSKKNIYEISEFDEDETKIDKPIDIINNDSCQYEKDLTNFSNDSTDSILSDANKEMQEIIFESELESNIKSLLSKSSHEKWFDNDFQFDKNVSKKEYKITEDDSDLSKNNKFSTLGKTAYAPRSSYDVTIGDVVKFIRQGGRISKGLVHFVGSLPNRKDTYLGIELEIEDGKHDGVYEGKRYFQCIKNKGVFVAFNKIIMVYSRKI